MLKVNSLRLERTVEELASIGRGERGITRLALSAEDLQARRYVMDLMESAGLQIRVDPVGNIYGKRLRAVDPSLPSVVSGSHICTGTHYGKYDGTIGVLGALEAVRMLNDADITTVHPIEVVVFTAEESQRFKAFMPGSQCVAGKFAADDLRRYKDEAGISLWDALVNAGYHPEHLPLARRTKETVKAYVELHIEQGPVLENAGKRIGVVTAIAASKRLFITLTGRADHSGATPMGLRNDALCAAAEVVLAVEQLGRAEAHHSSVATVGYLRVEPGNMVVIPGQVRMSVDIRSIDSDSKKRMVTLLQQELARVASDRGVQVAVELIQDGEPTRLTESVVETIRRTCDDLGIDALVMHSGAVHDAQQMATFTDVGMIFVPSVGGRSHCPEEYSRMEDIALGTELLANVLLKLSEQG